MRALSGEWADHRLPHQITGVYDAMLPRQPLRFLLADDPGAGKTIMAGLLIKELVARGDLERVPDRLPRQPRRGPDGGHHPHARGEKQAAEETQHHAMRRESGVEVGPRRRARPAKLPPTSSPASSPTASGPARLEGRMATLDTHAIARTLIDAGADPKLADAITAAVREAADHGDHVTPDQFKAGLAELEARLTWRFAGAMLAQTGVILAAVIGAAIAILRMLG